MNRHANAFTLIELLVVISIIALLIGILLPVLAASKQQARILRELAASRQLGQAYLGYALERGGKLMPGHEAHTEPAVDDQGDPLFPAEVANRWPWRLMRYIDFGLHGSLLVNEQARALADRTQPMWAYNVSLYPSLGLNMGNLGGDLIATHRNSPGYLTKIAQAVQPSRMIVFSSAGAPGAQGTTYGYWRTVEPTKPYEGGAHGWTSEEYRYPESGPPDRWGFVHPRWDGRAVAAHLDGHSELLTMSQMRDMTRWSNAAAAAGDSDWNATSP